MYHPVAGIRLAQTFKKLADASKTKSKPAPKPSNKSKK